MREYGAPNDQLNSLTRETQVAVLADFEGDMFVACHDRHVLAALSNRVLEPTRESIHQYG